MLKSVWSKPEADYYTFDPQADITAFELALIMQYVPLDRPLLCGVAVPDGVEIDPRIARHFKFKRRGTFGRDEIA